MKQHRRRRCGDCEKPLGGTTGYCYECGGEKVEPSREERLVDAVTWKTLLGVKWEYISGAHEK